MLAIRDRDNPCSTRISPSSLGLVTVITPSFCWTSIGAETPRLSSPLGPLTWTWRPLMETSTPLGMAIGIRPIRDMAGSLPDVGEDFPAYALLLGLLVGHQAGRRRDDRDAEATKHSGQVVLARIHPQAGLGHPLDARDGALPGRAELERDHQVPADLRVLHLPAGDVALLLENLRDVRLDLGVRHRHRVVVRRVDSVQTRRDVRDGVGHYHSLVANIAVVSGTACERF